MRKFGIFSIISAFVSVIAVVFASSACFLIFYQPKTPKCLK